MLYDLPGSLLQASVPLLKSYMSDRGGSLWWHFGPTFARAAVSASLREILPVSPKQTHTPVYREFHAMPVEGNLLHPAIRLGDDGASTRDAWNELPPFRQLIRADSITPRAVVLAETRVDSADLPVLAFLRIGAGKSLVSSAQPFWRWSLASEPYTAMADPHGEYVTGNLGWLTTREDSEPIRIVPDRRIVMRGEEVGFSGTAYDVGYRPLDDVAGTVTLRDSVGNALPEVRMTSRGDGTYRASLRGVAPGRYTYRGQFARGAEILRTQEGEIVVEPFSLEEQDLGDGRELLSQVSASTGGGFFEWRQFEQALAALPRGLVQEQKSGEFPLWSSRWLLFLMVLCLGLEWGIRKARGLL